MLFLSRRAVRSSVAALAALLAVVFAVGAASPADAAAAPTSTYRCGGDAGEMWESEDLENPDPGNAVWYTACLQTIKNVGANGKVTYTVRGYARFRADGNPPTDLKTLDVQVRVCDVTSTRSESVCGKSISYVVHKNQAKALNAKSNGAVLRLKNSGVGVQPGRSYRVFVTPVVNGKSSYNGSSYQVWSAKVAVK